MERKLYRDERRKNIGGVCAGLAEYFNIDVAIVRAIFLCAFIFAGTGVLVYVILWIVMPVRPYYIDPTVDYRVPPVTDDAANGPVFNNPYAGPAFSGQPVPPLAPRRPSNAGVIIGAVLVVIGSIILIDDLDLIPDFDFSRLWPVAIILAGVAILVSKPRKQPWEKADWHKDANTAETAAPNDNPTTEQL